MTGNVVVFAADAGSAAKGRFHWVSSTMSEGNSCDNPHALASEIVASLNDGKQVGLGYECPLFVPAPDDFTRLGAARDGECQKETGNRPFSAGAGASVLATGIQSLAWVLRQVKEQRPQTTATVSWEEFTAGNAEILIWEAFVSGSEKAKFGADNTLSNEHAGDAQLAVSALLLNLQQGKTASAIKDTNVFSLAGAAIIYAGLSSDISLLKQPCMVIRPHFSEQEKKERLERARQSRKLRISASK